MPFRRAMQGTVALLAMMAGLASAQAPSPASSTIRQTLDDAWWNGPMLAPSAATLPRGHFLIEPYLYDLTMQSRFDSSGVRRSVPHSNGFGSLTYMLYELAYKVSVGLIPAAGYNEVSGGPSSAGVGLGDLTLQCQYRLSQFHEDHRIPTISITLQETFSTGKYDRLGDRPTASAAEPIQGSVLSSHRHTSGCRMAAYYACASTCCPHFPVK